MLLLCFIYIYIIMYVNIAAGQHELKSYLHYTFD